MNSSEIVEIGMCMENGISVNNKMFSPFTFYQPVVDDHRPGYVYLFIAKGFHGWVPGYLLKRCKIGLSHDPESRTKQIARFEGSQPPCDIVILKTVYVQDMKKVENKLHKKFNQSSVKLKKSREWFDLWLWEIWLCKFWMQVYQIKN